MRRGRARLAQRARRRATSSSTSSWSTGTHLDVVFRRPGEPTGADGAPREGGRRAPRASRCPRPCSTGSAPATTTAPFCFIYQLPKGMRRSLYVKDDDYRLSFLYGNFTTLTRFTELDARAGPRPSAWARSSSRSTPPTPRSGRRCCATPGGRPACAGSGAAGRPGSRSTARSWSARGSTTGRSSSSTLLDVLDEYPRLATLGVVPLGLSRYSNEAEHARAHAAPRRRSVRAHRGVAGPLRLGARTPARLRRRRVLPAGGSRVPRRSRPTTGSPSTRTGSAWCGPSSAAFTGCGAPGAGVRHGFFACRRRRTRRRLPRPSRGHRRRHRLEPGAAGRSASLTGAYGAPVLPTARRPRGRPRRADRDGRQPLLRGQHRGRGPADRRRPRPGAPRRAGGGHATCCPTPACPRAASSTATTLDDLPRDGRGGRDRRRSLRVASDALVRVGAGA